MAECLEASARSECVRGSVRTMEGFSANYIDRILSTTLLNLFVMHLKQLPTRPWKSTRIVY